MAENDLNENKVIETVKKEDDDDLREVTVTFARPKESYRITIAILSVLLLASVMFSGFQSYYIFRLNNGLEGIFSYTRTAKSGSNGEDPAAVGETETKETGELPDPWFSIEEAAIVASDNKTRMSTVDIVEAVSPATVPISVIMADNGKETKLSSGTGFIITEDGYIVTNQHVVEMADESVSTYYVRVLLPDSEIPVNAEIVGTDEQTDIAVLKVNENRKLPCVILGDSEKIRAGELAVAIGNAMGTFDDTVTVGVISAPHRDIVRSGYYVDIIQTDAAINPGNSGGPLINSFGEVIGITNAKIVTSTSENLGFAIPINSVTKIIESLINYGKVIDRPYLGFSLKYVADASYYGAKGGVYVAEIVKDGPADRAGFTVGDRILSVDGVEITDTGDIIKVRDSHKVGDTIDFIVDRDGSNVTLSLTIGDSADY